MSTSTRRVFCGRAKIRVRVRVSCSIVTDRYDKFELDSPYRYTTTVSTGH